MGQHEVLKNPTTLLPPAPYQTSKL